MRNLFKHGDQTYLKQSLHPPFLTHMDEYSLPLGIKIFFKLTLFLYLISLNKYLYLLIISNYTIIMKYKLFLFVLSLLAIFTLSCSSDDSTPNPPKQQLIGTWKVNTVHFTRFVEAGIPANDGCMIEGILGYHFKEDGTFTFLVDKNSAFDPEAKKYWEWSGDEKGFEIKQLNPSMPPYDFGFKALDVKLDKNSNPLSLTFSASLSNGSEAVITISKGAISDTPPSMTLPGGEPFTCDMAKPSTSLKDELENTTWILESGQEVFKADFESTPTQSDRAKSILLLSLLKDGSSFMKYTFPMGIISAKADTWTIDEKENSFSTHYNSDTFGGNDLRFTIYVKKIDELRMEFTFKDDEGTNEPRIFAKHDQLLDTEDKVNAIDDILQEILEKGTSVKSNL